MIYEVSALFVVSEDTSKRAVSQLTELRILQKQIVIYVWDDAQIVEFKSDINLRKIYNSLQVVVVGRYH